MRTNYKQSRDHADSEYISHILYSGKGAEFIGIKQTDRQTDTQLHY